MFFLCFIKSTDRQPAYQSTTYPLPKLKKSPTQRLAESLAIFERLDNYHFLYSETWELLNLFIGTKIFSRYIWYEN